MVRRFLGLVCKPFFVIGEHSFLLNDPFDKIILEAIHNRVDFCRPGGLRGMIAFLPVCQYTVLVLG